MKDIAEAICVVAVLAFLAFAMHMCFAPAQSPDLFSERPPGTTIPAPPPRDYLVEQPVCMWRDANRVVVCCCTRDGGGLVSEDWGRTYREMTLAETSTRSR